MSGVIRKRHNESSVLSINNRCCWLRICIIPLRAKKYDESRGIWQARVNKDWRFYFVIQDDIYYLVDIIRHPK